MDRKTLISQLRCSAAEHSPKTPFCPDDHEIAAFVDGSMAGPARQNIMRHLAECQACISRVGLLTRLVREQESEMHATIAKSESRAWMRRAPQWAIAASVLLAFGIVATLTDLTISNDPAIEFQTTRNIDSQINAPQVLAPSSRFIGQQDELVIRWTEVPGALYYEVRVVSDIGNLVSTRRVEMTEWTIGPELDLETDREYFIRIDAFLTDAKSLSSDFIPFTIRR